MERWPALMQTDTAAAYLDMSKAAFVIEVNRKAIPYVKPTDRSERRYARADLDAYIERLRTQNQLRIGA